MEAAINTTDLPVTEQANSAVCTQAPEPYFFDVLDPAAKNLTEEELNALLLDRFLYIDDRGKTWNKGQVIEHLLKGDPHFEVLEHANPEVVNFGQDKAYVKRSIITAKGKFLGRELHGRFRCASMTVSAPGGWRLFNYQLTKIL